MFPISASAMVFSTHIQEFHEQIRKLLETTNSSVKAKIESNRREQIFKEGYGVLSYMRQRIRSKKLHMRHSGLFHINNVLGVAYRLALPKMSYVIDIQYSWIDTL